MTLNKEAPLSEPGFPQDPLGAGLGSGVSAVSSGKGESLTDTPQPEATGGPHTEVLKQERWLEAWLTHAKAGRARGLLHRLGAAWAWGGAEREAGMLNRTGTVPDGAHPCHQATLMAALQL